MSDRFARQLGEPEKTPARHVAMLAAALLTLAVLSPVAIVAAALLTLAVMTSITGQPAAGDVSDDTGINYAGDEEHHPT